MSTINKSEAKLSARHTMILVVLLASQFMLAVDFSILNVALPVVGDGLGFTAANLQWIATSFALCAAGFTLLFGRIGDFFGRRKLFLIGMAGLGIASCIGGLATSPTILIIARVAQGLSTAAVTPAGLALLTTSFPEGPMRARVLGLNSVMMSFGFTTGAILGGVLTDLLSWRWAFFVNVPVAAVVLVLVPILISENRPARRPKLDVPGAVTVTAGLLAIVFGISMAGEQGFASPVATVSLAVGAAVLAAFWVIEKRSTEPLVPIHILTRRSIAWGNIGGLTTFALESSLVFILTLYLQRVLGFSPLATGMSLGLLGLGAILGGALGPRVVGALGVRTALSAGLAIQAVSTIGLVVLGADHRWLILVLAATFVGAVGHVTAIVGFMVAATSGLSDEHQGLATGVATMTQQVGIALGIPIMSAVITAFTVGRDLLGGLHAALLVNGGLALLAAVLIGARLTEPKPAALPS